ncbi:MAG TPA: polyphosphate kinase 2 family protein [Terriglobales bacterium]
MTWASKLSDPYRIDHGKKFCLKDFDPADTGHFRSNEHAQELLDKSLTEMRELQDKLYAQDRWAVLIILQAMDAAGKDSVIKHVMSGVNPQGCQVYSFKQPSVEELNHDYLWRSHVRVPERGHIGIFNRSYYEEVLVVRVHSDILKNERLPDELVGKKIWQDRFEDIVSFERYLARNGVAVRKFFLNVSRKEQKRRFMARLDTPNKNWKFSAGDVHEREFWNDYMTAFEDLIAATAKKHAPWYVVPADNKWYTRLVVAAAIVQTLRDLDPAYPQVGVEQRKRLAAARRELEKAKS